jgi:site-specific DNA-methyltransferase (adenine-specific)
MKLNKIYNEDCYKALLRIKEPVFDAVIFSPPYNIGKDYAVYKDRLKGDEYYKAMLGLAIDIHTALKDDGHVFINVGYTNLKPDLFTDVMFGFQNGAFTLQNMILWVKSIHVGDKTHGHFKPINSNRFITPTNEFIFHFTKEGNTPIDRLAVGVPYSDKSNIKRFKHDKDLRCQGNTWFIPYETIQSKSEKGDHPATYPAELVERCIKLTGKKKGIVLDPFMGSGTTAVAALRLGWNYVGYELNPAYIEYAENRIKGSVL